ncbi:hypothetical protein KP509_11G040600 [Ceratopteris richardii]|uniref:Gamma-tubulin complex component n=1 Tax=Ceratopteris richardii TaxID=49495 RepID=A0A8T2TRR8_CERRI|nr:hypothetical protein KP509_11G040600 [Ceratopteris richardii]KAH7425119.1 hypothetical protein KP509_11G040600 [Ceratopteris richardii]KAH7425120.1 hypothetical protein KP509_11G040600 [Ceratopteris richardii]
MGSKEVSALVRELVYRLLPSKSELEQGGADRAGRLDAIAERAYNYAVRIFGSRIVPSIINDEGAMAESIKRQLVLQGRSSDALAFADLHRRFSAQIGPGCVENKWALLYVLRSLAEDQRRENAETRGIAGSLTSTLSGPASHGGLPALPAPLDRTGPCDNLSPPKSMVVSNGQMLKVQNYGSTSFPSGGVLILSKDTENAKASAIREFVELCQEESEISEGALVRDVLYACQGIDGRYVKFEKELDGFIVDEAFRVPRATRMLVRKLCEVGWLFRKVQQHIDESIKQGHMEEIGTVGQAFCASLQEELSDYYRLIAVLEAQVHNPIPLMSVGNKVENYLSLRRLLVWLAEPLVRMRLLAVLVDDCKGLKGGAMAGAIHMHAQHGAPIVRSIMARLLVRVCSPLFEMVRRWVLEGELDDIYEEFFVVGHPVKAEALWREGYRLQSGMLPSFIPESLAQRILRTGKSINFLRVCCDDHGWAEAARDAVAAASNSGNRGGLGYGETEALEVMVVEAARKIDGHVLKIMYDQYRLRDHCLAIKRYLLLGQGDFIQYLMDLVGPDLSQPANTVSSFKLAGLLESAIRASNAQYDEGEILDRLRVKMMPYNDGDRGWDVFSLEYILRDPLNTIFTEAVMANYLKVFNFLWRLKRVEHALSATWQTMKPNCSLARLFTSSGSAEKSQVAAILRRCQTLRNEMNHFVTNLQYYIMFEVLEYSWAKFLEEMEDAQDLDDLIAAHERYLTSIIEKSLLGERSKLLCKTLCSLFDLILRFRALADRLYENARAVQARSDSSLRKKLERELFLSNTSRKAASMDFTVEFLKGMGDEMDGVAAEYSSLFEGFIAQLPVQQHVDLKFLSFRLDFSEFYIRQHMNMSTAPLKLKRTPIKASRSS